MQPRRLVKAGVASHTISLPKAWLKKNNLAKGDVVYVRETGNNEIIITPSVQAPKKQSKEKTIDMNKKDLATVRRELTAAYINNYSSIVLTNGNLDYVKQLRETIHNFVALEVAEQSHSRIIAKDLLNLNEVSIEKTLRRMDMIIRSLMADAFLTTSQPMQESVQFRDADINRLYFMLFRLLKSALKDREVATQFDLKSEDILSTWYLIVNLENIADCQKNIYELQDNVKKPQRKALESIFTNIKSDYETVMKAYFAKDKTLADSVASKRVERVELCAEFLQKNKSSDIALIIENFKEATTLIANIARIVIDEDD